MFTSLSRAIKYGFNGFWRNGWLSVAATAIVFLALIGFGALLIFSSLTNIIINDIQDKIDISAYFKLDAPEDDILSIKKTLEGMPEVKSVEYISRDKALEIFKAQNSDNSAVSQALEELDANPVSASLNIKARDLKDYAVINAFLGKDDFKSKIDKVSYAQNATVIERLKKIKNLVEQGGLMAIIFISLVTALIIFNTIRLTIYSNRGELKVMRLVGASNFFIRVPYLMEGIIYGFLGSVFSLAAMSVIIYYIAPYLVYMVSNIDGWHYYLSRIWVFAFWQLIFGVVLSVFSSYIAVRKYLKV